MPSYPVSKWWLQGLCLPGESAGRGYLPQTLLQGITDALSRQARVDFSYVLALNCWAAARLLSMARSIRISVARAPASGSGTMLAPSRPLLRLQDRGTADRNPNQNPFPHESRTDVSSHKRRKRFS